MTSSFRPGLVGATSDFVTAGEARALDRVLDSGATVAGEGHPAPVGSADPSADARLAALERAAFERGAEQARCEEAARLTPLCVALEGALAALEGTAARTLAANRALLLELAAEIAGRWVACELTSEADVFADVVERGLRELDDDEALVLRLAAADIDRLEGLADAPLTRWRDAHGLVCEADPRLAPGDFRIEGRRALVDGRNEAILDRLRDLLRASLVTPDAGEGTS